MSCSINARMTIPSSVPATDPIPPLSSVPPITTAAIASSSHPTAIVGSPAGESESITTPASAASNPLIV